MKLTGADLVLENVWKVAHGNEKVELDPTAGRAVVESRAYIEDQVKGGEIIYGVNTGFGAFSSVQISPADIVKLQKNLIRSHSSGVGEPFTKEQSRAIMLLRANALARGHSGVRFTVIEKILEFLKLDIVPVIPQQGSVGASGDLAPLSHLALALIGEGEVWLDGKPTETAGALKAKGVSPLQLEAKEGLSLINGCQVMTAVGLLALFEAKRLMLLMDLTGAMSLEALKGSRKAFDPLIAATRPHPGEAKTAHNLLKILGPTSPIAESHIDCSKVQIHHSL
jgi:histidine ammonia-lyase